MSRTYTHEQVVQIIEEMIGHHPHLGIVEAMKHSPATSWDEALREVLRQLEALPVESPLSRWDCTCLGSCRGADGLSPGWHCALAPRPRQPTPTPDGPALTWCDGEHDWDGRGADLPSDGRMEVRCSRCPAVARRMASMDLTPEPTEPEVVWEDDQTRLLADGTVLELFGSRREQDWSVCRNARVEAIGRALAEAKRDVAKAAESMRERAATEVQLAGDLCEEWYLHLSDVRALEERIRALPLEAK